MSNIECETKCGSMETPKFSNEIYRAYHPSDNILGGVSLYHREGLPIKRRTDLELLQEMIVTEIILHVRKSSSPQYTEVLVKTVSNLKISSMDLSRF